MRLSLRWKILLITVLTPLSLGITGYFTVNRNVKTHVNASSIHESLEHSRLVFESMLAARSKALAGGAQVIARDPRFFSLLTLGPAQRDSRFVATVRGMAHDFNQITQTELFEVLDRRGRILASVGAISSSRESRDALVKAALRGEPVAGVLVQGHSHYQVTVTPVRSDGQIVGVLLLGSEIGGRLANLMRTLMRSEVTFLSGTEITGSTLDMPGDREALVAKLASLKLSPETDLAKLGVLRVNGPHLTYLTVVRRIPSSDPARPQLYVMQRSYDPETIFLNRMQHDIGFVGVMAVLAALVTGLILSETITRPIVQLVRGAQEMQKGNYAHPVKVRNKDEIGYLADRFMEMRQHEQAYVSGLEETARLKTEFISIASHELRTPISVIKGYRDLLEEGGLGPIAPKQREALQVIGDCLQRLGRIAEHATQVADVRSERLSLNLKESSIGPLLDVAVGTAMAAAPQREVKISTSVDAGLGEVVVDGPRLIEAIAHLITNSIRFTADGDHVTIHARRADERLVIDVEDEGPGIPADRLPHLFDDGHAVVGAMHHHSSDKLELNSTGLGLGLGVARAIVEAHGGALSAENLPERGSRFTIRVPLRAETSERRAA